MKTIDLWRSLCDLDDLLPDSGVAALIEKRQVALFKVGNSVYAIDNFDPNSGANVISRGIVGDVAGEPVVASPVYKHHFSLVTGRCLEDIDRSVRAWPVRVHDNRVWIRNEPRPLARRRKLVVVGNGMAGMKVVEDLLERAPGVYDITVIGAEPHGNYNRVLLSPVLAGEKQFDDIVLHPLNWYLEKGVELHVGDPAVQVDRVRRLVRTCSGREHVYDRLLLATGSNPIVLPVPGSDLEGVVTFRDLQDVNAMLAIAKSHRHAVVIGGGLLGLEAANGLARQGMHVTVVHLCESLMERQLDSSAAQLLQESLEQRGLSFRMPAKTAELVGSKRVTAVRLEDGSLLPADLVVMAVGIRPNTDLARAAGLNCARGVLVDDTLQTFDPSIYAVGECVQHRNNTYGLVAPLFDQAAVCAAHLAESGRGRYTGSITSTQLKVTGIDLFSAGDFLGGPQSEALVLRDPKRGVYKRLVIENNTVRGAVLYGDVKDGSWYFDLIAKRSDISLVRHKLLFGAAAAGKS
jgi:NAD(P)H-dependent nitrite reductase large subunit/NAD(P)H-dependent nitrite reductase small subunit